MTKKPLFLRISQTDKILFARQLSLLLKSGISILDALIFLEKQTKSKAMKYILNNLINDLQKGISLNTSLKKFENIFSNLFISLVQVGELSGNLEKNLDYLAKELKKQSEIKSKIISSLIYPAFILGGTLGIVFLMVFIVFPKIMPLFTELKVKLPITTVIFIKFSNFLINYWLYLLISIFFLIVLFFLIIRIKKTKYYLDLFLIKLPFLGKIFKNSIFISFTRNTALLIHGGVDIVKALEISLETISNLFYRKIFEEIVNQVKLGHSLTEIFLKKSIYFDNVFLNLVNIGEKTGTLENNFVYLAEYYEELLDNYLKNFLTILEPTLLALMGIIVAFIGLSIVTPIYRITQQINTGLKR